MENNAQITINTEDKDFRNVLTQLWYEKKFCDLNLKSADGIIFPVHKIILSTFSEYFRKIIEENPTNSSNTINLEKGVDSNALNLVLEFIYTGKIDLLDVPADEIIKLYELAILFEMNELKKGVESSLKNQTTMSNCLQLWRAGLEYFNDNLRDEFERFIKHNCKEFFETYVSQLSASEIITILRLHHLNCSQEDLYLFAVRWIKYNFKERRKYVKYIFENISFPDLPIKLFMKKYSIDEDVLQQNRLLNKMIMKEIFSEQGNGSSTACDSRSDLKLTGHTKSEPLTEIPSELRAGECKKYESKMRTIPEMKEEAELEVKITKKMIRKSIARSDTVSEVKSDHKSEVKSDHKSEIKSDQRSNVKSDLKTNVKSEMKTNVKSDLRSVQSDMRSDLRSELLKSDLKSELKSEIKSELKSELKSEFKSKLKASKGGTAHRKKKQTEELDLPYYFDMDRKKSRLLITENTFNELDVKNKIIFKLFDYKIERWFSTIHLDDTNITVFMGGLNSKKCEYFQTGYFHELPSLKQTRWRHSSLYYNGKIYCCGGQNNKTMELFDLNSLQWMEGPSLKFHRWGFGFVEKDGLLYAIGGYSEPINWDPDSYVEMYDPRIEKWQSMNGPNRLSSGALKAINFNNKILAFKWDRFNQYKIIDDTLECGLSFYYPMNYECFYFEPFEFEDDLFVFGESEDCVAKLFKFNSISKEFEDFINFSKSYGHDLHIY